MLTEQQRDLIKATVPVLESQGEALTQHFYHIMLTEYPQVRPLFNQAAQASGRQPRALANSLLMYAKHIDELEQLQDLITLVTHKHASLQIQPDQYAIVGTCLLRAIQEVLGPDLATAEVVAAWESAYVSLANLLSQTEESLYQRTEQTDGGWRGERLFYVADKVQESSIITSFYLKPVDGKPVLRHQAGQYLGFRFIFSQGEQRRNYSLSAPANGQSYRISVKREPGGLVSNYLHDTVQVGDELRVFPPFGHFTLQSTQRPIVLLSAGVGITPMIPLLEEALGTGQDVVFVHAAQNHDVDPFYNWLYEQAEQHPQLTIFKCYENNDSGKAHHEGMLNEALLGSLLPHTNVDVYYLGPTPFMAFIRRSLENLGVPATQCYYEFFGPAEALD